MSKHILLTESQVRMISEEIEKNDKIQKLLFTEPEDISFEMSNGVPDGVPVSRAFNILIPTIDGVRIGRDMVRLECEEYNVDDELFWQLHIEVNPDLRRMGIAEKLYTAFILKGNKVLSIFKNRVSSFYDEYGKKRKSDSAISNLWEKLKNDPRIITDDLGDADGNIIGIVAEKAS